MCAIAGISRYHVVLHEQNTWSSGHMYVIVSCYKTGNKIFRMDCDIQGHVIVVFLDLITWLDGFLEQHNA